MRTSVLAVALLCTMSFAQTTPLRIVGIGDSVTKGVRQGITPEQTFCAIVEARLKASGRDATVINSGVGSDTTELGVKRFEKDVLAHEPTHVLIMFGLNDVWRPAADKPPLVEVELYEANLIKMIEMSRQKKAIPIIMTPNPWGPAASNGAMRPYVEACRRVARTHKVALADVYGRFAELAIEGNRLNGMYFDDCHIRPDGHEIIAELMLATLDTL